MKIYKTPSVDVIALQTVNVLMTSGGNETSDKFYNEVAGGGWNASQQRHENVDLWEEKL